jgi:hydroxymethylbilane synthase
VATPPDDLRLGTRGSQLALWQAETVAAAIARASGRRCRLVIIRTSGDRLQSAPVSDVGGKRLFVKEIEDALLQGAIDLAVHSSKDLPAELPAGLDLAGVLPREDPRDAVVLPASPVSAHGAISSVEQLTHVLGTSPTVGTGSVRRATQLTPLFPGARFTPIRGNLDTRLRRLDEGQYDGLVLAVAGLRRLGFAQRVSYALPVEHCVPAPGQGIVAVEIRGDDGATRTAVNAMSDRAAAAALSAERALLAAIGGGCRLPVGALATPDDGDGLHLTAVVVALDGSRAVRAEARGTRLDASGLGRRVADELLRQGAAAILADAERALVPETLTGERTAGPGTSDTEA